MKDIRTEVEAWVREVTMAFPQYYHWDELPYGRVVSIIPRSNSDYDKIEVDILDHGKIKREELYPANVVRFTPTPAELAAWQLARMKG